MRNAAQNHEEAKEKGQYEFEGFHSVGFKGEWIQMYAHFCNDRNLIFAELNTLLFVLNSNCPHLRGEKVTQNTPHKHYNPLIERQDL